VNEDVNPYDHIDIDLLSNRLLKRTASYDMVCGDPSGGLCLN
jgi:hypothetical protein